MHGLLHKATQASYTARRSSVFECQIYTVHSPVVAIFFFRIVSNFNTLKILTFFVHAGLFWSFHNQPKCNIDYRIFNVPMWSFRMRKHTGEPRFIVSSRRLVECRQFDSGEISGRAQSLAHNGHPSIWWPRLIVLNFDFREGLLLLCVTESSAIYLFSFKHSLILRKEDRSSMQIAPEIKYWNNKKNKKIILAK